MTIEECRAYIARKQSQIEDLESRYGRGVRPSWVGEELTVLHFYIMDAEDQIAEMEKNNGN
jgi:hypothetical protein